MSYIIIFFKYEFKTLKRQLNKLSMQHNIGSNDIITIKNYFSKNGKVSMKLHIENIIEKIEILD